MEKKFHITTFGCQMNEHDSETLAGMLLEKGYTQAKERKDANIVRTSRNGMLWEVMLRPSLRQCPQWTGSMCAQEHMEFWPRSDPESSCLPSADV